MTSSLDLPEDPVDVPCATERADLGRTLSRALGDPTLEVWFWMRGGYVDARGRRVGPIPTAGRGVVVVTSAGERIGAITYSLDRVADRGAVEAVGHLLTMVVEQERLAAELSAVRASLRDSLERVVEASDVERRRIARDLHDGLQSRLILMGMSAQRIERDPTASPSVSSALAGLREALEESAKELRRLVDGVMPAALLERGLSAATENLVASVPISTSLTVSGRTDQLPSAVESTAYFVVTEAVTNVLKHAAADELSVEIEGGQDHLRIVVSDNGVGGAVRTRTGGLTGLADRVGALGGHLEVRSLPGRGTRILAEVPSS